MQQWIIFNLPESVSQEAPQSQASPHVLCWVPLCMNLRLHQTPRSTAALFTERCPIGYYPVLVTKTAGAFSLSGTQHPQGWHLDSSVTAPSLPIMTVTFLTDVENSLLKIFLAEKTDYFLVLTRSTYYDMQ